MKKIVFITGATSGIGKACAEIFASNGFNVIITGRRKEKLNELQIDLQKKYNCEMLCLSFDVQDKTAVFNAIDNMPEQWKSINVLINNAGLSIGRDSFNDALIEDWEIMMQTNVNGLLYVSKALLYNMILHKTHIINIGSIAGKEVYENGNIYCASKFAVDAISRSMRVDLLKYGNKITVIHPGAVETAFSLVRYKGDQEKAAAVYKGFIPLTAEDIASTIFYTANLPAHVCINEVVITPTQQASTYYFHKT